MTEDVIASELQEAIVERIRRLGELDRMWDLLADEWAYVEMVESGSLCGPDLNDAQAHFYRGRMSMAQDLRILWKEIVYKARHKKE